MRIGELAERSGVAAQTIRFYERAGVIAPAGRSGSGYREYPESAVDEVRAVRMLKGLGFRLREIRGMAAHGDSQPGDRLSCLMAGQKVAELGAHIAGLSETLEALERRRAECGCAADPELAASASGPSAPTRLPSKAHTTRRV